MLFEPRSNRSTAEWLPYGSASLRSPGRRCWIGFWCVANSSDEYAPATLFKMPLREGAPGSGLQVPLEGNGSLLVGELDRDVKLPRPVSRGMGTPACVVVGEAGRNVRSATDIEMWLRIGIFENVDESLVFRHARPEATPMPDADFQNRRNVRDGTGKTAVSATRPQVKTARICADGLPSRSSFAARLRGGPPSPLRGFGATSFAWLAEP